MGFAGLNLIAEAPNIDNIIKQSFFWERMQQHI